MSVANLSSGGAGSAAAAEAFSALHLREAVLNTAINEQVRRYRDHRSQLVSFLETFEEDGDGNGAKGGNQVDSSQSSSSSSSSSQKGGAATRPHGRKKYLNQLQQVVDNQATCLTIDIDDVEEFFGSSTDPDKLDPTLPARLMQSGLRYSRLFHQAAEIVREQRLSPSVLAGAAAEAADAEAVLRVGTFERGHGRLDLMRAANVPVHLRVPYEIRFRLGAGNGRPVLTARELRGRDMGAVVLVEGVVLKTTAVRPKLTVAAYRCTQCYSELHQPVEGSFTPLVRCDSAMCTGGVGGAARNGELQMIVQESKFVKYQEIRIQEPTDRVPTGCVPRTQRVIAEGSMTRVLLPGMRVVLTGVLAPVARTAAEQFARRGAGGGSGGGAPLIAETAFYVHDAAVVGEAAAAPAAGPTLSLPDLLQQDPQLYERMAWSLAPGVHGLMDVKKALLLQLVGGVPGRFNDGMQVRGDIHVLLMGDPGVAKSQLLAQVCKIAPRAHYATGKGSSGVGLTAAVVRDPNTGDLTLEGGAIVLSDRGLCCIDEFDKMDEFDRTTIHEVMEQQTVSVSKAGLVTTLNARAAILAAANPQYGRYDVRKTPAQNVNLPAALVSRFDIVFLLIDKADTEADHALATHVLEMHRKWGGGTQAEVPPGTGAGGAADGAAAGGGGATADSAAGFAVGSAAAGFTAIPHPALKSLIAHAKTYSPLLPPHLRSEIVSHYVDLRQREKDLRSSRGSEAAGVLFTYTTPRTLLGVLRLAQAHARLRCASEIDRGDFEEALRLIDASKRSVADDSRGKNRRSAADFEAEILDFVKDIDRRRQRARAADPWIALAEVEDVCSRRGFVRDQVRAAISAYVDLGVLAWKDPDAQRHLAFAERLEEEGEGDEAMDTED